MLGWYASVIKRDKQQRDRENPRVAFSNFMIEDPKNPNGQTYVFDTTTTADPEAMSLIKKGENNWFLVKNKTLYARDRIVYTDRKLALQDARERTTKQTTFVVVLLNENSNAKQYVVVPTCFPKPMKAKDVLASAYFKNAMTLERMYDTIAKEHYDAFRGKNF